jgi:hypothetical protein
MPVVTTPKFARDGGIAGHVETCDCEVAEVVAVETLCGGYG